jgi:hypothetical protein
VVLVLVAAVAAGALAAYAPVAGIALAVVLLVVALLGGRSLPDLGRATLIVALVAAIIGPNLGLPGQPEIFAFRLFAVLIILGLVAWLLMGRGIPVPDGLGLPMALVAGWVGWALASVTWAASTGDALRWTVFLIISTGLMLAIPIAASRRRYVLWVLGALGATFVLAILGAFAEIFLGVRFPASAFTPRIGAFAATSFFGNQNNFATYLALSLPYLVLLPVVARDARLRIAGAVGAVLAIGFILVSGSKSNLIAVGIILLGMLVVLGTDRSMRRAFIASVVVGLEGAAVVWALIMDAAGSEHGWLAPIGIGIAGPTVVLALAVQQGFRQQSESADAELMAAGARLQYAAALAGTATWHEERRLSRALHGPVQTAVRAAAMRIEQCDLASAERMLVEALGHLDTDQRQTSVRTALAAAGDSGGDDGGGGAAAQADAELLREYRYALLEAFEEVFDVRLVEPGGGKLEGDDAVALRGAAAE